MQLCSYAVMQLCGYGVIHDKETHPQPLQNKSSLQPGSSLKLLTGQFLNGRPPDRGACGITQLPLRSGRGLRFTLTKLHNCITAKLQNFIYYFS